MRALPIVTGSKYNRLVVEKAVRVFDKTINRNRLKYQCRCDCGGQINATANQLINATVVSCGCYGRQRKKTGNLIHGWTGTPEHATWMNMVARCYNSKSQRYRRYGGRGIKVCERWIVDFQNFLADMGPRPKGKIRYTIERIDNDGNYEPSNCYWATYKTQLRNTRRNRQLTVDGFTKTVAEWAEITGLTRSCIYHRMNVGWEPLRIIKQKALRP